VTVEVLDIDVTRLRVGAIANAANPVEAAPAG
jgi:O-acetyl-ADP-ribose deacetylase (regulator of RNase III)